MVDKQKKLPELLAPAGDMERLKMAVLYGADAVYLAGTSFGMRSFAGNFNDDELPRAVAYAHAHGVRVHATVNTMPRFDEAERLPAGPICSPSLSSIKAAIYPNQTDYYFYALGKDGVHHFFKTYAEHLNFINSSDYQSIG